MKRIIYILIVFLVFSMVAFPAAILEGATTGLNLWWNVVLPALLPFLMVSEILLNLGLMEQLGRGFEKLMRPLFRLPGEAALGLVMGYFSGFPAGAAVAAGLRRQGLITREEGNRLIAFNNNPSPLFITLVVATGILGNPGLGGLILLICYGVNLILGVLLGLKAPLPLKRSPEHRGKKNQNLLPFGKLLKNAAKNAGGNIAIIGCYLVFFSILSNSIDASGINTLIMLPLKKIGLPEELNIPLLQGLWEMTLGINSIGQTSLPLNLKLALSCAMLSFGGIGIHAQVAAMIADTDLSLKLFLKCRIIQSLSVFALTYIICGLWPLALETSTKTPKAGLSQTGLLGIAMGILLLGIIFGKRKTPAA